MAEEYKRKWHEHHNPREDDKVYFGTRLLDAIEKSAVDIYQDERTLEGWEWLNPVSVGTAGAIRTVEGVGTVLANTPVVAQGLQAYGKVADVAAGNVGSLVSTTGLDPRFGGWAVRLGEAWYGGKAISAASKSKYVRKVAGALDDTAGEIAQRTKARRSHKWTRPGDKGTPIDRSDVFSPDDLTGPKKTYIRIMNQPKTSPKAKPPDPWNPPDLQARLFNYIDSTKDIPLTPLRNVEDLLKIQGSQIAGTGIVSGVFNSEQIIGSTLQPNYQPKLVRGLDRYRGEATTIPGILGKADKAKQFDIFRETPKGQVPIVGGLEDMTARTPYWKPKLSEPNVRTGVQIQAGYRFHHESPLAPSAAFKAGLSQEAKELADIYMLQKGLPQGDLVENITTVPHDLHMGILHKEITAEIGRTYKGDAFGKLVHKWYPNKKIWELELWERTPIFDDYIAAIQRARQTTYDFYRAVAAFKDMPGPLSTLDVNTIIDAAYHSDRLNLDTLIEDMIGYNKRIALVKSFKSKFKTDFEEAVSQRITKSNPLPRLIENFTNNEARAWKAFGDALGIDFTPDGQLVRRPVLSTQQINKKYKNFNVNQMELALDKITPENRPEFILRMKLARGKTMRKQPSSPSEFGQDDFD